MVIMKVKFALVLWRLRFKIILGSAEDFVETEFPVSRVDLS